MSISAICSPFSVYRFLYSVFRFLYSVFRFLLPIFCFLFPVLRFLFPVLRFLFLIYRCLSHCLFCIFSLWGSNCHVLTIVFFFLYPVSVSFFFFFFSLNYAFPNPAFWILSPVFCFTTLFVFYVLYSGSCILFFALRTSCRLSRTSRDTLPFS